MHSAAARCVNQFVDFDDWKRGKAIGGSGSSMKQPFIGSSRDEILIIAWNLNPPMGGE